MTQWPRFGLLLTIVLLLPAALAGQDTRNVLVLQEGYSGQPGSVRLAQGLHEVLDASMRNQIFNEYLDESRLHADDAILADMLRKKYRGKKLHAEGPDAGL